MQTIEINQALPQITQLIEIASDNLQLWDAPSPQNFTRAHLRAPQESKCHLITPKN